MIIPCLPPFIIKFALAGNARSWRPPNQLQSITNRSDFNKTCPWTGKQACNCAFPFWSILESYIHSYRTWIKSIKGFAETDFNSQSVEWSFQFNIPLTTTSWRRDLGLKSHPKDWRCGGSNQRPQDCRTSMLTTAPRPLLFTVCDLDL